MALDVDDAVDVADVPFVDADLQESLPAPYYLSPAIFDRERERIFYREWICADSTITCDFLFHPSEIEKDSFDPSDVIEFWDLVNQQDWGICEGVQRGMSSRSYRIGYYAPMEDRSLDIRRYIADQLDPVPKLAGK